MVLHLRGSCALRLPESASFERLESPAGFEEDRPYLCSSGRGRALVYGILYSRPVCLNAATSGEPFRRTVQRAQIAQMCMCARLLGGEKLLESNIRDQ